ncbi:DUF6600 domain-containing protein [Algoriphagus yeomjeoni]|uniref:DUF6600 domain-containing protein n=1 Tax=Algoriphagus yeomjeoni TaxID=291403 RepID=UPI003CE4E623
MKTLQVPQWMRNLMMGFVALLWLSPSQASADDMNGVSFQVFYDELMPYGDWVKDGRYGYVWLPAVQNDFHPYGSNGHWVMTEYGNTWVSDYDWGWATFHYGRWYFDNNYQSWAWIPDYTWGPAWVDWRSGGGYYGWAPMGPGFSINVRIGIPASYWLFVPQHRFAYRNVYNYYVPYGRRVKIYNNTTIINNTVVYNNNRYYAGPSRREIQRVTRTNYPVHRVESARSAGRVSVDRNTVSAYRPDLNNGRTTTTAARPSRVLSNGQSRIQPATAPSRGNSRTETVSGRSANSSAGSSRATERTSPTRSSETTRVRTTTPSSRGGKFKTEPYSGSQTRTSAPSRQSAGTPSNSRSSETRTSAPTSRQPQTRTAPTRTQSPAPTQRTNESRTQPAPTQRSSQPRTQSAPTQRSTQSRTQPSSSSRPVVKSTTPTRSTQSRTQSAPSRSPQVKSAPARSSSPAKSSSRTSSSSTSRSTSRTRGNN